MSVQNQINRLEDAKAALKTAIEGKGVTVPTDVKMDDMADLVDAITPKLQAKTIDPATSTKYAYPDDGYDGLSQVTVNAIPTVTQATPTIEVSGQGLITAKSTQNPGYVSSGTKSATYQLDKQAGKIVTPSTSQQTAVASGKYTTGTIYVSGDANLKAGNIKNGVSIFGVEGTMAPAPAETWVINASPSTGSVQRFDIGFTSNSTAYTVFALGAYTNPSGTTYNAPIMYAKSDGSYVAAYKATKVWTAEAYRTVTFDTAPTGALLTWLQANAVKKLTVQESKSVTITENGTTSVTPDDGYESIGEVNVEVSVEVSGGGGFPNGTEWTRSNITSRTFNAVSNANGIWVACGEGCGLYYSADGKTWTRSNNTSSYFTAASNANGIWVACGDGGGLYYSVDGKTWTKSNITSAAFTAASNANGIWVASSKNGLYYSADGKTWTQSNITSGILYAVSNANGIWVAGSSTKGLYYSTDGKTWTQSNITNVAFNAVSNANGIWVACGDSGGLYYSTDGKTWTKSNITSAAFTAASNANGIWVASSKNGLYYSADGKTWTQSNNTSSYFTAASNANGIWVASSKNGLYYSVDGKTWTQSNITSGILYAVSNANGIWVACGSTKGLYYSVSWEPS